VESVSCIQNSGQEWKISTQNNRTHCHSILIFTRKEEIHTNSSAWCMVLKFWWQTSAGILRHQTWQTQQ
jgi:hypothetical protein